MDTVDLNLAELIVPHKYRLNTKRAISAWDDALKSDAPLEYDFKNSSECKDMLELILRTGVYYDRSWFTVKNQYDPDEIKEYIGVVDWIQVHRSFRRGEFLLKKEIGQIYASANQRCADGLNIKAYAYQQGDQYLLICSDGKTETQHKISRWQAYYINISNIIIRMGPDADFIGKRTQLYDNYTDFVRRNGNKRKLAEVEEKEIIDQIEKKIDLTEVEKYKLLLSKNCNNWFQTAQKEAELENVFDEYMRVKIDSEMLVLNAGCKYNYSQYDDFSKKSVADVKQVTIRGDDKYFAYAGFIYNGTVYQTNVAYRNMYSYIESGHGDVSMIPEDLVALANSIKREVGAIPETEHFSYSRVECEEEYIDVVTTGPRTLRTYLEFDLGFERGKYIAHKHQYFISKIAVGKYEGKYQILLKIGSQLFIMEKIPSNMAGEILINQRIANSKREM